MSRAQRYWNEDAQRWEESPGAPSVRPRGAAWPAVWAVAAAVVVVSVVGAVVVGAPGDDGPDRAGASTSPTASERDAPTDSEPSAEPSAAPSAPADGEPPAEPSAPAASELPDGYKPVHAKEGFSTAILKGWRERGRSRGPGGRFSVSYGSTTGPARSLIVFRVTEPTIEESFDTVGRRPGFGQPTAPEPFAQGSVVGKLVEYRLDSGDGDPTRYRVDIRFEAADGKLYGVIAQHAGDEDLTKERWVAATAAKYFCPPDTDCESGAFAQSRVG